MKIIDLKINHQDDRGFISDIIENEQINAVTFISIKKGKVRGNHYHKDTMQYNYVISGVVELITKFPGKKKNKAILEKGDTAYTEPKEEHALYAVEDAELLIFTRGPRGGKEYESDTFRLVEKLI
jgi:quercetin dioxygenase-like cupin family protein